MQTAGFSIFKGNKQQEQAGSGSPSSTTQQATTSSSNQHAGIASRQDSLSKVLPLVQAAVSPTSTTANDSTFQQHAAPRDKGWWQSLNQLYYINFGSQYGMLPRMKLDPAKKQEHLIAFVDPADAEFVANTVKENLVLTSPPSEAPRIRRTLKGRVVSARPFFLQDMAQLQGVQLEVLPQGRIQHNARLTDSQLQALLTQILTGKSLLPRQTQMPAQQWDALGTSKSSAMKPQGCSPGGFSPISTDLPGILQRSLSDFPGLDEIKTTTVSTAEASGQVSDVQLAAQQPPEQQQQQSTAHDATIETQAGTHNNTSGAAVTIPSSSSTTSSTSSAVEIARVSSASSSSTPHSSSTHSSSTSSSTTPSIIHLVNSASVVTPLADVASSSSQPSPPSTYATATASNSRAEPASAYTDATATSFATSTPSSLPSPSVAETAASDPSASTSAEGVPSTPDVPSLLASQGPTDAAVMEAYQMLNPPDFDMDALRQVRGM